MKLMAKALGLAVAFACTGLSAPQSGSREALLGLRVMSGGLSYFVYTGGCTQKSDFTVNVMESYPPQLELVRWKPDLCEAWLPDGIEIFFSWEELGLQAQSPFKIVNPLRQFRVPG